ncbi:MAG: hypothetical protein RBU37_02070, partial [Myxococcota bacterium]|nr:hypothetical protein [Myxococcota bacterium]
MKSTRIALLILVAMMLSGCALGLDWDKDISRTDQEVELTDEVDGDVGDVEVDEDVEVDDEVDEADEEVVEACEAPSIKGASECIVPSRSPQFPTAYTPIEVKAGVLFEDDTILVFGEAMGNTAWCAADSDATV